MVGPVEDFPNAPVVTTRIAVAAILANLPPASALCEGAIGYVSSPAPAHYYVTQGAWRLLSNGGSAALIYSGNGSPEGVVTAPVSALYLQLDGANEGTLWRKVTGAGNTGWFLDAQIATVPNIAAMPPPATLRTGALVYVATQRSYYRSDGGSYVRTQWGDPQWCAITQWSVNGLSGNDENDGTIAPLATFGEIIKRIGVNTLNQFGVTPFDVVVDVLTALPNSDPVSNDFRSYADFNDTLQIRGVQTTIPQGTGIFSAAVTAINHAGNAATIVEAAALPATWTALGALGKTIVMTSNPIGASAVVVKDLGGANKQALVSPFRDFSDPILGPGPIVTPGINAQFKIVNFTGMRIGNLSNLNLVTSFLDVQPESVQNPTAGFSVFSRCNMAPGGWFGFGTIVGTFYGCSMGTVAVLGDSFAAVTSCGCRGVVIGQSDSAVTVDGDTVFAGAATGVQTQYPIGALKLGDVAFFDCTTAISVQRFGVAAIVGAIYGTGAGIVINMQAEGRVTYVTKPTATSTVTNARFGPVPVDKAWAAIPYTDEVASLVTGAITGSRASMVQG